MTAADLDRERLLTLRDVLALIKMSKSWLYAEIKAERFPAPLAIGTASRWKAGPVYDWLAALGGEKEAA